MDIDLPVSPSPSRRRCIWILFLLLLLFQPAPAEGHEPRPETSMQTASVSAPLLGWSWNTLFSPVQSALGNRRRMVQMATIGMCIGLYILMRK